MNRKKDKKDSRDLVEAVVQRVDEQLIEDDPEEGAGIPQYIAWEPTKEQFGGPTMRIMFDWKKIFAIIDLEVINLKVLLPVSITTGPHGHQALGEMILKFINNYNPKKATPDTKVGVSFKSPEYDAMSGLVLPFTLPAKVKTEEIVKRMDTLSKSSNSPLEVFTPILYITLKYITSPRGSGKRKSEIGTTNDANSSLVNKRRRKQKHDSNATTSSAEEKEERSNIMYNGVLKNCLPHAAVQSHQYMLKFIGETEKDRMKATAMYRQSIKKEINEPRQCKKIFKIVADLKKESGLTEEEDFGYSAIKKLQDYYSRERIQLIVVREFDQHPYFAGPFYDEHRTIAVLLHNLDGKWHYSGIRKLHIQLGTAFFCRLCHVRAGSSGTHYNCPRLHRPCGALNCKESPEDAPVRCDTCEVVFRSNTCLDNHLQKGPRGGQSRCEYTKKCTQCNKSYYTNKRNHKCGKKWCSECQDDRKPEHFCTMKKFAQKDNLEFKRFVYEFKSAIDEDTGEQTPILFTALKYCQDCYIFIPKTRSEALNSVCVTCSPNGRCIIINCFEKDQRTTNVAQKAAEWIFSEEHKDFVGITHDASGSNAHYILFSLISDYKASPAVVMKDTKIISLKYRDVHLINSMEYFTTSLESVVKTLKIGEPTRAFPMKLIDEYYFGYEGEYPGNEWYDLEFRPTDVREELIKFLDNERSQKKEYNFGKEFLDHCFSDVSTLACVLVDFEQKFYAETKVRAFKVSATLSLAARRVFQTKYLKDDEPIALDVRPSASRNCSVLSQKFLAWLSMKEKIEIAYSATTGEHKVGQYSVDGFISPCKDYKNGLVYEIHGCYWHAHECRNEETFSIGDKTATEIRARDKKRLEFLEEHHEVKVVWECEVKKQVAEDPEMTKFFDDYEPQGLKEMEKALASRRTEVFKLKSDNKGKSIEHVDLASTYSAYLMDKKFPIGLSSSVPRERITTPITHKEAITWNGFITCQVVAPRKLEIPLLATDIAGKTMYILCAKCAEESNQESCEHGAAERSFKGIFTTVEVEKAIDLGYIIKEVFDAKEFKDWDKNDESGKGKIFNSYITEMMALQIQASGVPSDIRSNNAKTTFVRECKNRGILLKRPQFLQIPDPSLRLTAELLLNSISGEMTKRVDMSQTAILNNTEEFWKLFNDDSITIEDVWTQKETIVVRHTRRTETWKSLRRGSIHISAFVASYARLHLYDIMEKIGPKRICLADFDSVVYTIPHREDDPLKLVRGGYLGQCTSVLAGEVSKFVSTGAGSYAYLETLRNGATETKIKTNGVLLNFEAAKRATMEKMEQFVGDVLQESTRVTTSRRDRLHNADMFNRRVLKDGSTLPFGYVD